MEKYCRTDRECSAFLEKLISDERLSARAYTRILKVSRTVADLDGAENIRLEHIAEATGYRLLDKKELMI